MMGDPAVLGMVIGIFDRATMRWAHQHFPRLVDAEEVMRGRTYAEVEAASKRCFYDGIKPTEEELDLMLAYLRIKSETQH